jgi:hypothetical protein
MVQRVADLLVGHHRLPSLLAPDIARWPGGTTTPHRYLKVDRSLYFIFESTNRDD